MKYLSRICEYLSFVVKDVDCWGAGNMLTDFAFNVKAGFCFIWSLLSREEFASDEELARGGGIEYFA